MTLDELRERFWWLGPSRTESYIVEMEGNSVTVKVIQCSWNRRTQLYEEALARDFAKLGLAVTWRPFWSEVRKKEINDAKEAAQKQGHAFDEAAFVASKQAEELKPGRTRR